MEDFLKKDMLSKKELRTAMKHKRAILSTDEVKAAGRNIYEHMAGAVLTHKKDAIILMFVSYNNEPDTYVIYDAIRDDFPEYDIAYPLISEDNINMEFYKAGNPAQPGSTVQKGSPAQSGSSAQKEGHAYLIRGYKGIMEPDRSICEMIDIKDMCTHYKMIIILLPGLAFDSHGNRTGYGGGFYDRYLARLYGSGYADGCDILTAGICHDFQYIEHGYIITDGHDIQCDCIITDKRIIWK